MRPSERRVEVMRDMLVELLILLFSDFILGARPQRRGLIHLLLLIERLVFALVLVPFFLAHQNRNSDVIGILTDDRGEPLRRQEVVIALAQMQNHIGAAPFARRGLDGIVALPIAFPTHSMLRREARAARDQRD